MFGPDKYFPIQGIELFETVSFPITKAFAVDFGAMTSGTATRALAQFPKGAQILSFTVRITEALATGGAGTIKFGFSATPMLTSAAVSTDASLNAILGPMYAMGVSSLVSSLTAVSAYTPMVLKANDTFDIITGTTAPGVTSTGTGKADCYVTYVPIPYGAITTSDFLSVVVT